MSSVIGKLILIVSIIFLIFLGIGIYLYVTIISIKNEKRITDFALSARDDTQITLFEHINNFLSKIISKLGKLLVKNSYLKKLSQKYEKYIPNHKKYKSSDYIALKFLSAIVFGLLMFLLFIKSSMPFKISILIISIIIGFFLPNIVLKSQYVKKQKEIQAELLDVVIFMNNSFKNGLGIYKIIDLVSQKFSPSIKDEFKKIKKDLDYGLDLNQAFKRFKTRINLKEVDYISNTLELILKNEGNVSNAFALVESYLLENQKSEKESLSIFLTEKQIISYSLLLPPVIIIIILFINKNYFNSLLNNAIGIVVILTLILVYLLYILIIKKILKGEN